MRESNSRFARIAALPVGRLDERMRLNVCQERTARGDAPGTRIFLFSGRRVIAAESMKGAPPE